MQLCRKSIHKSTGVIIFLLPGNPSYRSERLWMMPSSHNSLCCWDLLTSITHRGSAQCNFTFHWKGSTHLWSISFWMSLFSSSTFCWSFFLLCSGGRLLKSSGPAPCTEWNGGWGGIRKKINNQSLKKSFGTAFWKRLTKTCAKSQWSEALLSFVLSVPERWGIWMSLKWSQDHILLP